MCDLSTFVKELKQRFSRWYNKQTGRKGTLWEERFKSVLIEDSDYALSTITAYIDLNAVRAGMVDDPKDYRFCGYGEAVAGGKAARAGLQVLALAGGTTGDWKDAQQVRIEVHDGLAEGANSNPQHYVVEKAFLD